jgi:hypothetical protein
MAASHCSTTVRSGLQRGPQEPGLEDRRTIIATPIAATIGPVTVAAGILSNDCNLPLLSRKG